MKIAEFVVAEVTPINSHLNRVCLDGGFADAKTRVAFNTNHKLKVGQVLTLEDSGSMVAPKVAEKPVVKYAESKPAAKAPELAPTKGTKRSTNF